MHAFWEQDEEASYLAEAVAVVVAVAVDVTVRVSRE